MTTFLGKTGRDADWTEDEAAVVWVETELSDDMVAGWLVGWPKGKAFEVCFDWNL